MTIDEFMKNVAPYMKKCWLAMDKDGTWCRFSRKPHINMTLYVWDSCDYDRISDFFVDIEPVEDWTKSLRRIIR